MLLKPKLIVINISIYNITGYIPGPGTNFPLLQIHEKNVPATYITQIVLNLTTSYQWKTQWETQWGKTTSTWLIYINLDQIIKLSKHWHKSNKSKKCAMLFVKAFWCNPQPLQVLLLFWKLLVSQQSSLFECLWKDGKFQPLVFLSTSWFI